MVPISQRLGQDTLFSQHTILFSVLRLLAVYHCFYLATDRSVFLLIASAKRRGTIRMNKGGQRCEQHTKPTGIGIDT